MSGLVQPKDLPAMASAASSKSRKMLGHLLQQDKSGGDGHKTEIVDSGNSTVPCWKDGRALCFETFHLPCHRCGRVFSIPSWRASSI